MLLVALAGGCAARSSGTASDPVVIETLRARSGALQRGGIAWIAAVVEEFRRGTDVLREGRATRLSPDDARRRIEAADVLLVADVHDLDPIRTAFARLVAKHGPSDRSAIVLEALPPGDEAAYDVLRTQSREELLGYLQATWPWPVERLADMLAAPDVRRAAWLGAGNVRSEVPPDYTPDRDRQPVIRLGGTSVHDAKYGLDHAPGYGRNGPAADRAHRWLERAKPGAKAFVLYGFAHYLDGVYPGTGIRGELERRGHRVLVLVPFLPEWELAVRERGTRDAWLEVLPGVLRPPTVSDEDILRFGS
jgi:hypothetical protein